MQCKTAEELIAYAKTEGVELTVAEAEAYLAELSEYELSDGDLKYVAGGAGKRQKCLGNMRTHYRGDGDE